MTEKVKAKKNVQFPKKNANDENTLKLFSTQPDELENSPSFPPQEKKNIYEGFNYEIKKEKVERERERERK